MNIGNIVFATPKLTLAEGQASMQALLDLTANMGGTPSAVRQVSSYLNWYDEYMIPNSSSQDVSISLSFVTISDRRNLVCWSANCIFFSSYSQGKPRHGSLSCRVIGGVTHGPKQRVLDRDHVHHSLWLRD